MRKSQSRLIPAALLALAAVPGAWAADVTLSITAVKPDGKPLFVDLCTAQEYGKSCALRASVPADSATVTVPFANVAPGRYVARVFHDRDGDGKMKRGLFGEPVEPWGMSRDAEGNMGPPAFDDAAFEVGAAPVSQSFKLR